MSMARQLVFLEKHLWNLHKTYISETYTLVCAQNNFIHPRLLEVGMVLEQVKLAPSPQSFNSSKALETDLPPPRHAAKSTLHLYSQVLKDETYEVSCYIFFLGFIFSIVICLVILTSSPVCFPVSLLPCSCISQFFLYFLYFLYFFSFMFFSSSIVHFFAVYKCLSQCFFVSLFHLFSSFVFLCMFLLYYILILPVFNHIFCDAYSDSSCVICLAVPLSRGPRRTPCDPMSKVLCSPSPRCYAHLY